MEKLGYDLIGIIDVERIKSLKNVGDFTAAINEGYGLRTGFPYYKYHANDFLSDGNLNRYADQFVTDGVPLIITIKL